MVWLPRPKDPRLASDAFPLSLLIKGLLAIVATEALVPLLLVRLPISGMVALGILRLIQSIVLLALVHLSDGDVDWHVIGLGRGTRARGWRWGLMGAALFALAALGGGTALYLLGMNPLRLIHTPLPAATGQKALFFIVGGCIAPITEEVFFRGYLYTYCRRWGVLAALALSTAVFVALHLPTGLPITQLVGGVVFALAYEYSESLIAAFLIHSLGNLAIFCLSLI
jgi:uncharacterized protein